MANEMQRGNLTGTAIMRMPISGTVNIGGKQMKELRFMPYSEFPEEGREDVLYIDTDGNAMYYWDGTEYIALSGGGSGGTSNYNELSNKPSINDITLTGNKTSADLGLQPTISDLATIRSGAASGATAVQPSDMETALASKQDVIDDLSDIRTGAAAGETAVQPSALENALSGKQDVISDLADIRSGAAAGATAVQPSALNDYQTKLSGTNKLDPSYIDYDASHRAVSDTEKTTWNGKQDTISDLATIRSGAAAGATALQQSNVTSTYSASGTAPVNGTAVNAAIETLDVSSVGGSGKYISEISETGGKIAATAETMDTTPTANSTVPVTSGGVAASQAEQDAEIAWNVNQGVKNIIDIQHPSTTKNTNYVTTSDGGVELSCSNATWTQYNIADIPVTSGSEYTFIFYVDTISGTDKLQVFVRDTDSSGTTLYNSVTISATGTYTATITPSASKIWVGIYLNNSATAKTASAKIRVMLCPAIIKDSTFQPYALPNPILTPAAIKAVDEGAKNIQPVDIEIVKQSTTAGSWNGNVYTESGTTYTINDDGTITVDTTGLTNQSNLFLSPYLDISNGKWVVSGCPQGGSSETYYIATNSTSWGNPKEYGNSVELNINNGRIRLAISVKVRSGILVFRPMICTAADWAISQKFVPYAPTNRELYEMIQMLQNNS